MFEQVNGEQDKHDLRFAEGLNLHFKKGRKNVELND